MVLAVRAVPTGGNDRLSYINRSIMSPTNDAMLSWPYLIFLLASNLGLNDCQNDICIPQQTWHQQLPWAPAWPLLYAYEDCLEPNWVLLWWDQWPGRDGMQLPGMIQRTFEWMPTSHYATWESKLCSSANHGWTDSWSSSGTQLTLTSKWILSMYEVHQKLCQGPLQHRGLPHGKYHIPNADGPLKFSWCLVCLIRYYIEVKPSASNGIFRQQVAIHICI